MTDRAPHPDRAATQHERTPKRRASKRQLRAVAWVAGGAAFAAPFGALAAAPEPADRASSGDESRPVTVVRRITKRIVITHPSAQQPPVQYVTSPGSSVTAPAPAAPPPPPPPPTTSTSGS